MEKTERQRIFNEGYAAHLSVGSVHVYIVKPDGHLLDSMHVAEAAKPERLIGMLEKASRTLSVPARTSPTTAGHPTQPAVEPNSVLLHLVARYLDDKGNARIPNGSGNWDQLPSEDWIAVPPADQAKLAPKAPSVGGSWDVDPDLASRLLKHFYPPTENWDWAHNDMESMAFRGRVTTIRNGIARAQLEGDFKMRHTFYHKDDNNRASGHVAGWMEFDTKTNRLRTLHLVSDHAVYGEGRMQPFGVAVLSK